MKFVSFQNQEGAERAGLLVNGHTFDLEKSGAALSHTLPSTMGEFLKNSEKNLEIAKKIDQALANGDYDQSEDETKIKRLAPVPHPTSCRDAYAFRQHVATARRNRGVPMIAEFDQFPVFYFTNHNSIIGGGDLIVEADHLEKLDFELEAAIVIGKNGKNIEAKDADSYIFGYTIMNDFSARLLQMEEMKLNLGPAKGKDFATSIGPYLVTPDELADFKIDTLCGAQYDLRMTAKHNGKLISDGNLKDMNWTFAEIIERASYGVELYAGDVIGSGTVGTGCYLELNGTRTLEAKEKGETYQPLWLKPGDTIELEIKQLGALTHTIVQADGNRSILAKKKPAETTLA